MNGMFNFGRRLFMKGVMALGAAHYAGTAVQAEPSPGAQVAHAWLRKFSSLSSARAVGRAYLAGHPAEADAAILCHHLQCRRTTPDLVHSDWSTAIREDFERGDTVCVHGWVLSRTEVRLCALAVALG